MGNHFMTTVWAASFSMPTLGRAGPNCPTPVAILSSDKGLLDDTSPVEYLL